MLTTSVGKCKIEKVLLCYKHTILFRRGNEIMSEKGKKNENKTTEEHVSKGNDVKGRVSKKKYKFLKNPIVQMVAPCVVPMIFTAVFWCIALPNEIENINEKLDKIEEMQDNYEVVNTKIDGLSGRISTLESLILNSFKLQPTTKAIESMKIEYTAVDNIYYLSPPTWKKTDIIAKDIESGREYCAEELVGEKLLFPYVNNGQEVIFWGQFDTNNQWNGQCLINVYENEQLILIMDAYYDHGELVWYKQVIPDKTQGNVDIWIISERTNSVGINSGESWNYIREEEYNKKFEFNSVQVTDMIDVDQFIETIDTCIEGYYCGDTANGFYNDDTGSAYLVKYAEDGTVRTLYCGKFKDGQFDDDTGNAWYITKNDNTDYMYYKGNFKSGVTMNDGNSIFENELTLDRILELVGERNFKCELEWQF